MIDDMADYDRDVGRYTRRFDPGFGIVAANDSRQHVPAKTYESEFPDALRRQP